MSIIIGNISNESSTGLEISEFRGKDTIIYLWRQKNKFQKNMAIFQVLILCEHSIFV